MITRAVIALITHTASPADKIRIMMISKEKVNWTALKMDLQNAVKNEEWWAKGAATPRIREMHLDNAASLKADLELVEEKDLQALIALHDEEYFDGFLI